MGVHMPVNGHSVSSNGTGIIAWGNSTTRLSDSVIENNAYGNNVIPYWVTIK